MKFFTFLNNLIKSRNNWLSKSNNIPNIAPILNKKYHF